MTNFEELEPGVLRARFTLHRGRFELRQQIEVSPGEILAVIGPNGAGKTSLIGGITGALPLTQGKVTLGDQVLVDTENGKHRTYLPRHERNLGHLDQRARLFPHLNARDNVGFGPRAQGSSRHTARALAERWLDDVGMGGRERSMPHELSGGEQQRVAIARTFAVSPGAILLDEPFSALDVETAGDIRLLVRDELRHLGIPAILVTHDPVDLLTLADRVVILDSGTVQQVGTVSQVIGSPAVPFAASFTSRILLRGVVSTRRTLLLNDGPILEIFGKGQLPAPGQHGVATYDPAAVEVNLVSSIQSQRTKPLVATNGTTSSLSPTWIDTVATLTKTSTGVRITGRSWPEFHVDLSLARTISLGIREGDTLEFTLSSSEVKFARSPQIH